MSRAAPEPNGSEPRPRRPEWLREGVLLTGTQEALAFTRRRGSGLPEDPEAARAALESEARIAERKAAGFNLFMTSGQKGAGFEAEREDIERSRRVAKICHAHGLRLGAYVGNTLLTETAFVEMPESRGWVRVGAQGQPCYYWDQTFRQEACRANPGYMAVLKRVVKVCIEEIGADLIHFDNWFRRAEPLRCRCEFCRKGFREFLVKKYPPEQLRDRLGFSDVSQLDPPPSRPGGEPWTRPTIEDPLVQEWMDYGCQALADAYGEMAAYVRSLNPDVAVECNPYGLGDANSHLRLAVDHPRLLAHGDAFWSEESARPGINQAGDLESRIRTYKMGRTLDQVVFTYTHESRAQRPSALPLAEAMAFNQQTLGAVGHVDDEGESCRYVDFRLAHRDLYLDTRNIADAAVLHNFDSLAYNAWAARLATQMAEQALIQGRVPFDIIFDQQLSRLESYRTLVLAEVECLSDEICDRIREWVRAGGGLVATGRSSTLTPWRRSRAGFALGDLFGADAFERAQWGPSRRAEIGRGRVAYLPEMPPMRPIPLQNDYLRVMTYQLPANWREFLEAVAWASRGLSVEVAAPPTVAAEFLTQPASGRAMVHLVNFAPEYAAKGVRIRVNPSRCARFASARLLTPDPVAQGELPMHREEAALSVELPRLEGYGLILFEP